MRICGWAAIVLAALAGPAMAQPARDPSYDRTEREPDGSLSIGKYLFTAKAMDGLKQRMHLSDKEVFGPELQDRMMTEILAMCGLDDLRSGKITAQQFQHNWAVHMGSIADPATNASLYGRTKFTHTPDVQAMIAALKGGQQP
jgi:muramidase (phage lysozyme)